MINLLKRQIIEIDNLRNEIINPTKKITIEQMHPLFIEYENLKNKAKELQKHFNELGHREGEDFIFNEGIVKTTKDGDKYISFMGKIYYINGLKGKLYETGKDDNGEGYIYIGGTAPYINEPRRGDCYILRSNGLIFEGDQRYGGKGTRYNIKDGVIYNGDIELGEPIDLKTISPYTNRSLKKGTYFEKGDKQGIKKTSMIIHPKTYDDNDNNILYETDINGDYEKNGTFNKNRGNVIEITKEAIGEAMQLSLSSWGETITFYKKDGNYIFDTDSSLKNLTIPVEKGKNFMILVADLINYMVYLYKQTGFFTFYGKEEDLYVHFTKIPDDLYLSQKKDTKKKLLNFFTKTKLDNEFLINEFLILKNTEETLGINIEDFIKMIGEYCKITKNPRKEKRGRPNKI